MDLWCWKLQLCQLRHNHGLGRSKTLGHESFERMLNYFFARLMTWAVFVVAVIVVIVIVVVVIDSGIAVVVVVFVRVVIVVVIIVAVGRILITS